MTRIDLHAASAVGLPAAPRNRLPRIATLSALGMDAILHIQGPFRERDQYLHVAYIAIGSDGRLRSGTLQAHESHFDVLREWRKIGYPSFPIPDGPEAMAEAIAAAVDIAERAGSKASIWGTANAHVWGVHRPFALGAWHPWAPEAGCEPRMGTDASSHMLSWLEGEPADCASIAAAWARTLGPRIAPEAIEAMSLFSVVGCLDPVAFDAACDPGPAGRARRDFATRNPLLANLVLAHPTARGLVDAGASLREVLGALPGEGPLRFGTRYSSMASRRAISNLSGTPLACGDEHHIEVVAKAADVLPREWMPRTPAETKSFAKVCLGADAALGIPPRGKEAAAWWRGALAGVGGRWQEYESRIIAACSPGSDKASVDLPAVLGMQAKARMHFVTDIVVPLALAHGTECLLSLASRPSRARVGMLYPKALLDEFVHRALVLGMALPAIGDMGTRHEDASRAIKAVVDGAPVPGPGPVAVLRGLGWFDLCEMPNGMRLAAIGCEAGRLPVRGKAVDILVFEPDTPNRSWSVLYLVDADRTGIRPPVPQETMEAVLRRWGSPEALLGAMTGGKGIPALGLHPIHHDRRTPYDASAPGTLDAMIAAWRPVMPRRWRRLDAAGLAAVLEAEAMAFRGR